MSKSGKLVFFGTEDFSATSLEKLLAGGWQIELVITKPDSNKGRGQALSIPRVKELARQAGINVAQPHRLEEVKDLITGIQPEAGILVSYGKIIPKAYIDLFPRGIINVHPSLLPRYRGPAPIEAAILNDDDRTGVSLMTLSAKMDAGPIYVQEEIKLTKDETKPVLYSRLAELGARLLCYNLAAILSGKLKAKVQDETKATYTKLLTKADGVINLQKPASVLAREVRAYLGYPKSRVNIKDREVVILKAREVDSVDNGILVVLCGGGFLEVESLISPSGKTMSGAEFLRGLRD